MANPVKAAKTVRKARQAAEAAAKAKATAEAAAKAKAAAETASKARTAATAATKAEAAAKAAEGAKTASGAASAADRAEKLAARAERMASRSGAREAVAKARARAQGTAAAPAAPAPKPAAAPAAPAAKPAAAPAAPGAAPAGEDWTFFRNMKQSRGYDQSKWNRMLKDATNPADVQAHARGFGFSMTEDQAKQVLAWRDTQKAGNTPAWQRMTSPTPTSTPSTPRTGSNPSRPPAPGSRSSTHTPPRSSAPSSTPPASGAPAAAPDAPERLSFVNSLPFGKGWKAETKGVPRSNWAKAAATAGAIYAGDKLLNTGLDPDTGGAIADAFTQVPKGPGDSFIGTGVANLFAGLQTGVTGRPSGLAPTRGQYDGWSPELVASLPGIQKAVAERTALAAALKQASEVPDMSPTALNGLLGQIRKSYDEGMALTNGLVGADLDKMTEHHTNVYRQRLGMLQNLPAMKNLVKGNADRVAQMVGGLEGSSDLWTDEDRARVQPVVDNFYKQPIENQVFFDFDGLQKAIDTRRAAGRR